MQSIFHALSHPERRAIIQRLKLDSELSAGQLADAFPFSRPTLTHHLNALVDAELLERRKQGNFVLYSLNLSVLQEATERIFELLHVGNNAQPTGHNDSNDASVSESGEP